MSTKHSQVDPAVLAKARAAAAARGRKQPGKIAVGAVEEAATVPLDEGQYLLDRKRMDQDAAWHGAEQADFFKPKQGENRLRFLMNPAGYSYYAVALRTFLPGAGDGGKGRMFNSPKSSADPKAFCPLQAVCDKLQRVAATSADPIIAKRAKEIAWELRPRAAYFSNVLVKSGDSWQNAVYQYGWTVWKQLRAHVNASCEDDDARGDYLSGHLAHPTDGTVVVLTREGSGMTTTYTVSVTGKRRPVTAEELDRRTDVDALCEPHDAEEIKAALCAVFCAADFDELVHPNTPISLPVLREGDMAMMSEAPAEHPRPATPGPILAPRSTTAVRKASESVEPEETPDAEIDVPICISDYGNPMAGLVCAACGCVVECKAVFDMNQ